MLSVLIVCRQVDEFLMRTVKSVVSINPQVLINISERKEALGIRKNRLIDQAANDWVLILDTDEKVSAELVKEIRRVLKNNITDISGYVIPYQNYIFGKPVHYGGENYFRAQLFNKQHGRFTPKEIHEYPVIEGKTAKLNGVIRHYSYVTFSSVLSKFTQYAWRVAGEKHNTHERVTVKKLVMYGPHMVWARAVKDEGWRDGWRGIVIALCFGYMEALTYWFLLWRNTFSFLAR